MAKTSLEKIADWNEEIAQIKNKQKVEKQKHAKAERAARTKRLCQRHGLLESMLPEIAGITDEQYKSIIEKAVDSEFFRQLFDGMTAMAEDIVALEAKQTTQADDTDKAEKSAPTAQSQGNGKPISDTPNSNHHSTNSTTQKPNVNQHHRHNLNHKPNGNDTRQGG